MNMVQVKLLYYNILSDISHVAQVTKLIYKIELSYRQSF